MSNQSNDGFQGSQPFITDNDKYNNLTEQELKLILKYEKQKLKKIYNEFSKKQKLIKDIKKLQKLNDKLEKGIDIRKPRKKSKPKKIKTFDEYFQTNISFQ